jgi:hypothetical protein
MLALAQPAQAKIVYTNTWHTINSGDQPYPISLNNDGQPDLYIDNTVTGFATTDSWFSSGWVSAFPLGHTGVAGPSPFAYALSRGARIGPARPFSAKVMANISINNQFFGQWIGAKDKFLGVKFYISGKVHYGWARFSVKGIGGIRLGKYFTVTLEGYAYETVPNKPIIAGKTKGPDEASADDQPDSAALTAPTPEPGSLGLLAMGWPGLSVWRRKESVGATQ